MNRTQKTFTTLVFVTLASGMAALIFQTLWARSFSVIFGSTVQAAAAVFASFLTGLALGADFAGRRSQRLRRPVEAYVLIEILVAASALVIGLVLQQGGTFLAQLLAPGAKSNVLVVFPLTLAIILVPAMLMGATFPVILTIARSRGCSLSCVGRIYGYNTFGAALGAFLTGFILIGMAGMKATLFSAAALDLVSAALCARLLRGPVTDETAAPVQARLVLEQVPPQWLLVMTAFLSGAVVLGLEVIWLRLCSYFLGNRTFAFSALLTSVLALLAAGAWLSSMLLRRHGRDTLRLFAWAALSAVAGIAVSSALVHIWIFNHAGIEKNLPGVQSLLIFYRIGAALVLMAPALVPLGMLFPMALTASRQAENRTGREAGFFYLVNTAGSVTGSLGVGFFLILFSGSYGSLKILAGITGVLAVVLFVLLFRRLKFQAAAGMLTVLLLLGLFPLPARLVYFQAPGDLLYWHEDEQGIFQIVKAKADGTLIVTNDATALVFHAGNYMTSFVQQMQGHLGVMFRPHARNVAVIGSGYGITAGAMTRYSGLTNIDAVEIIPSMIATAGYYGPWNFNYYKDSRVHLHIDDGRHFLARAKKPYDIISVNVTDPELPGAAALFHHEFYEMVKRKLTPDGILVQHVFGYQTARALATMSKTFPCILLYRSYANGFNVVAAQRPLHFSPLDVQALLAQDKVKKALYDIGFIDPLNMKDYLSDGLPYEAVFDEYDRNMLMATDDHPRIEFSWNPDQFQFFFSNQ